MPRSCCGSAPHRSAGRAAQADSAVLLKNDGDLIPLATGSLRVYAEGIDRTTLGNRATLVDSPMEADVAVLCLHAPWREDPNGMTAFFHGGRLDFVPDEIARIGEIAAQIPTAVLVYLERPAVLTELESQVTALVGDFGAEDEVLAALLFGESERTSPFRPSLLDGRRRNAPRGRPLQHPAASSPLR